MAANTVSTSKIELGYLPTHLKFVGGLVPDDEGNLPRGEDGRILVVSNAAKLVGASPVKIDAIQVPYFPGMSSEDAEEVVAGLRELNLAVHLVMMVGGADPMVPADEDKVVDMLVAGLSNAAKLNAASVASTSVEEWMQAGATRKVGPDFEAAIEQNVKLHVRAYEEAGVAGSNLPAWHMEFLRPGEFQTFTNLRRIWRFVKAVNQALGKDFFKVLIDAAHCGDSDLDLDQNIETIREIGEAGGIGIFHASAKSTRGCLSTDDGWIGTLLTAVAETGSLKHVFAEMFHHEDEALQALRDMDPQHGADTTDGREYDTVLLDGLVDVSRRLNNFQARTKHLEALGVNKDETRNADRDATGLWNFFLPQTQRITEFTDYLWFNGELMPSKEGTINLNNQGLHYGGAIFEGMRSYQGRDGEIFKLDEHIDRLVGSAREFGYDLIGNLAFDASPKLESWEDVSAYLKQACSDLIEHSPSDLSYCYFRPIIWPHADRMGLRTDQSRIHMAVSAYPWKDYTPPEVFEKGKNLIEAAFLRYPISTCLSRHKISGLYCTGSHCMNAARREGFDDALFLDTEGHVAETTSSNIFFWKSGTLVTPEPDCFLDGITRRTVMDLAEKAGIQVEVRRVKPEEIKDFDGAFVTGTAVEIVPINSIRMADDKDSKEYGIDSFSKTKELSDEYNALVGKVSAS